MDFDKHPTMVFKLAFALFASGFQQSSPDHSLFLYEKNGLFLALLIYVHALVLTRSTSIACDGFKQYLQRCFKIKDLEPLKYFLGIEAAHSPNGLYLCQNKYTLDILSESDMIGA